MSEQLISFPRFVFLAALIGTVFGLFAAQSAAALEPSASYTVVRSVLVASADAATEPMSGSSVSAQSLVSTHVWAQGGDAIDVVYNPANTPGGVSLNTASVIQGAIATWNAVTPSSFAFAYAGTTAATAGSCDQTIHLDGINTIAFAPLDGQLAITCAVFLGSGETSQLVEFDMIVSNDATLWASSPETPADKFDLPSTILHELGHAAGLAHSLTGTVMDGTLAPGVQRRALTDADFSDLRAAYPAQLPAAASPGGLPTMLFRLRQALVAFD